MGKKSMGKLFLIVIIIILVGVLLYTNWDKLPFSDKGEQESTTEDKTMNSDETTDSSAETTTADKEEENDGLVKLTDKDIKNAKEAIDNYDDDLKKEISEKQVNEIEDIIDDYNKYGTDKISDEEYEMVQNLIIKYLKLNTDSDSTTESLVAPIKVGDSLSKEQGESLFNSETQIKLANETITGNIMPINESNSNKFYFSTLGKDEEERDISKIYSYDKAQNKLVELYWERMGKELWLLGIEDNRLIINSLAIDSTPGACYQPWLDKDNIDYLDLSDPAAGTETYEVPQEIIEQALTNQKDCKKTL